MATTQAKVTVTMKMDVKVNQMDLFEVETVDGKKVRLVNSHGYSREIKVDDLRRLMSEVTSFLQDLDRVYAPPQSAWPQPGSLVDRDD